MRRLIRALPLSAEAFIIIIGAFGLFLLSTAVVLIDPSVAQPITESALREVLVIEPIVIVALGAFLWLRDWTPVRLGLLPHRSDAFFGLGIVIATYGAIVLLHWICGLVGFEPSYLNGTREIVKGHLMLTTVLAVTCVNSLYEEVFVCGYLIAAAKERSKLLTGVNVSVGLRLAYHLYQGSAGVLSIIPFGMLCAWWFAKTGRLWPVIIAHVAVDLIGLGAYIKI